jgi:hypothetical protein
VEPELLLEADELELLEPVGGTHRQVAVSQTSLMRLQKSAAQLLQPVLPEELELPDELELLVAGQAQSPLTQAKGEQSVGPVPPATQAWAVSQ